MLGEHASAGRPNWSYSPRYLSTSDHRRHHVIPRIEVKRAVRRHRHKEPTKKSRQRHARPGKRLQRRSGNGHTRAATYQTRFGIGHTNGNGAGCRRLREEPGPEQNYKYEQDIANGVRGIRPRRNTQIEGKFTPHRSRKRIQPATRMSHFSATSRLTRFALVTPARPPRQQIDFSFALSNSTA